MNIWGFKELDSLFEMHPHIRMGILVDTNILVSATYDLDRFNEDSRNLINNLLRRKVPLLCISNIKSEFLEIHRRILLSEAILDLERAVDKSTLPPVLSGMLTSYRARFERRLKSKPDDPPLRLSDLEIKNFKMEMVYVQTRDKDLWNDVCEKIVGNKLQEIWEDTQEELALSFMNRREGDMHSLPNDKHDWRRIIGFMSRQGLSSADAIILNAFSLSDSEAMASSDIDIGISIKMHLPFKQAILPDDMKMALMKKNR